LTEPRAEPSADTRFRELLETVWRRIDREELARFAQELVRIPSVYRPEEEEGNEERVARFLADYLEREGFEVHIEEAPPGRPNVWTTWEGDRAGRPCSSRRTPTW
jgi:succinyl-diaminopimelate desuccinylase